MQAVSNNKYLWCVYIVDWGALGNKIKTKINTAIDKVQKKIDEKTNGNKIGEINNKGIDKLQG